MAFHRFTVPVYSGGLRGGDDYINHGDGGGTPAPAEGALASGVNVGSYFFGSGEQITVGGLNRGFAALAENCDFLDDELVALTATVAGFTTSISDIEAANAALDTRLDTVEADLASVVDTVNNVLDAVRTLTEAGTLHSPDRDATLFVNPPNPSSGSDFVDTSFNLQLPDPATCAGWKVFILNSTGYLSEEIGAECKVTLVRAASEKINGYAGDYVLNIPFGGWWLVSDGTDWHIRVMGV